MRGVQQRLDRLGYHLRSPGQVSAGLDGIEGRITEAAVIAFQADFRPTGAGKRLFIRGEWDSNPEVGAMLDSDPSATDGAATQAALHGYGSRGIGMRGAAVAAASVLYGMRHDHPAIGRCGGKKYAGSQDWNSSR